MKISLIRSALTLLLCGTSASVFAANFEKGMQCYKAIDYDCALNEWRPLAEQGDAESQAGLGMIYGSSDTEFWNSTESIKWYRKAADQGHTKAQVNLAWSFLIMHDNDSYSKAFKLANLAVQKGGAEAQALLGQMYFSGYGVTENLETAFKWYHKAAEQGNADAQTRIGMMYFDGEGVTENLETAFKWYHKAAEQGDVDAQFFLGDMYYKGKGGNQSYIEAAKWYRKAAEQGSYSAQINLAPMYESGQGVVQNDYEALKWYRKAVDQGFPYLRKAHIKLENKIKCKEPSSTKLFGEPILCANRAQLMAAVKSAGNKVILENKKNWGDKYDSSSVLKGSNQLNINYTVDDYFAEAKYTFPSRMDTNQVTQIRDMVSSKYGAPLRSSGNVNVGEVTHIWKMKNGIKIKVYRGWPNTTTYLSYTHPQNYEAMVTEQTRQQKAREAKEHKANSNAF